MTQEKDNRPACQLTGEDGNVFAIIGRVKGALRGAGQPEKVQEFVTRAFACPSYGAVLELCSEYVRIR